MIDPFGESRGVFNYASIRDRLQRINEHLGVNDIDEEEEDELESKEHIEATEC